MLACDCSDQLISNYHHSFKCFRIWMTIMFHALDIIRINAFIAHKNIVPTEHVLDQKDFVMAFVDKLIQRAEAIVIRNKISTHENTGSPAPLINKRMRYSHTSPSLPEKDYRDDTTSTYKHIRIKERLASISHF